MNSRDFSIVVQGPMCGLPKNSGNRDATLRCLASIRTFLPGAEIVLSTWEQENTEGLDYDVLVKSIDPQRGSAPETREANLISRHLASTNVNRQIVSTRAGLAVAHRPFAVKFRGDLYFESAELLRQDHLAETLTAGLFQSRIVLTPSFTKNSRYFPSLFYYSDIVQAGRTEDLIELWSIPLTFEPGTDRLLEGGRRGRVRPLYRRIPCRILPEQYIIFGFMQKRGYDAYVHHPYLIAPRKVLLSERILIENFRVLEAARLGVRLLDAFIKFDRMFYRGSDWEKLSLAYRHPLHRRLAQADLLLHTYWSWLRQIGLSVLHSLTKRVRRQDRPDRPG